MDLLIAAGGSGQEVAAAAFRLAYLAGVVPPRVIVFDSDVAQRPTGEAARTRMEVLSGLDQTLQELGVLSESRLELVNPSVRGLVEQVHRVEDIYANTGHLSVDDQALMSLLLDAKQRQTPVSNGFHGEPAVGSLLFAGAWALGTFKDFEHKLRQAADSQDGLRVVLTGSVAGGVGTAVLPFVSQVLRRVRETRPRVDVLALLQLPWFTLFRAGDDPFSIEPDVTQAQFDRNAAGLVRGYLEKFDDTDIDALVLLGLPKPVQRVSQGGDRQLETHHYLCVCAGLLALNLLSPESTERLLGGKDARGVFGLTLKNSRSPSAFDGPPAGPGLYLRDRTLTLRHMLDVARSLKAYTAVLSKELKNDAPSSMHHASVYGALKALNAPQKIHDFRTTVGGFDRLHEELLEWLQKALESKVGGDRADPLGVFDPPGGWDKATSVAPSGILKARHRAASPLAPPRRLLTLRDPPQPHVGTSGRDAAWMFVKAARGETLGAT